MSRPAVWAPRARNLELELEARRVPMTAREGGWWESSVELAAGTDYRFALDGRDAFPDPRSPWQPEGVFGPSRTVDHDAFTWLTAGFRAPPLASAVVYELHIGTFSPDGTFDGAIDRLDHLVGLGVTHVQVMPVAEFPGSRGWGYDGVDIYAPHHAYGGPDGFKRLVDAAHGRGLAVILDVVYNHLGPSGNFTERFGPYASALHRLPWGAAMNFDGPGSDEVRRYVLDNARMWLRDYHVDGLRLDAIHAITDTSAVHILEELALEVDELEAEVERPLVLLAESDLNDPRVLRSPDAGGYGIDAQWNNDFHHSLHTVLTGEKTAYYTDFGSLADLAKSLEDVFVYDGTRRSHHRDRRYGRLPVGLSGTRFLGCLQDHDQVGNRPDGGRAGHLLSPGRLRAGATLVLTSPFVPMLFQGDEWAASTPFFFFTEHSEAGLGEAIREGRRSSLVDLGWDVRNLPDPQNPKTFERSKLDWREVGSADHADVLDWNRRLVALRRSTAALRDGRLDRVQVSFDEEARWLAMRRQEVVVAVNFGGTATDVPIPGEDAARRWDLVLEWPRGEASCLDAAVRLPPDGVAVLYERT